MLHYCIAGERVGEDGGEVVGVDRHHDDDPGGVPAPPGERGREPPFFLFFFFLDLPPRWEKGFPSSPWPPWRRRGESPSEIVSLYLFPSVSALPDSALSLFLIFPEIRNSDWIETLNTIFLRILAFLR